MKWGDYQLNILKEKQKWNFKFGLMIYIDDMENFIRNKFPVYKFFYVLLLNQRHIVHLEFLIDNFILEK